MKTDLLDLEAQQDIAENQPIIPEDISELAGKIVAAFEVDAAMQGLVVGLVSFGLYAERMRCAYLAEPVSMQLAEDIWSARA